MTHDDICRLLDEAKRVTGSDGNTARRIHSTPQLISNWRVGQRPMPLADIALVAQVAGLDPVAWTARAVAEPHEGTAKGDALQNALKKALQVTGVAIASAGVVGADYFTRCIEVLSGKRRRSKSEYQIRHGDRRNHQSRPSR